MQTGLYVALSGQLALDRRLTTLAHNIANGGTAGFRAEETHFESLVSRAAGRPTAFSSAGASYLSTRNGGLSPTGNQLDVAVRGSGFLAIQTGDGIAYTRDGRLRTTAEGELQTLSGNAVLDAGGASITLDPTVKTVHIAPDGMITQNGRQAGALGLFQVDLSRGYTRVDDSGIVPVAPAEPVVDFASDGFAQGYVESSNVNGVLEMTRLIAVTRAFERLQGIIDESQAAQKNAIQALGA
jgi:flagellar basal-body rod protein FlgF